MTSNLADSLGAALGASPSWKSLARPAQLPPAGDWRIWIMLAGRGSGKTRAAAEYVQREVQAGRARHVAVVGRTAADVRDVMIEGPSGLLAVAPDFFRPSYEPSKRRLTWPNGAVAVAFSADEPDLLRGPQHDLAWCDELAAWERAQETWDNLMLGLRLGQARCAVSTTPRPIPLIRALVARDGQDIALSRMTTYDNLPNLAPAFAQDILTRYAGTHLAKQELLGELVVTVPGALWTPDLLEKTRVQQVPLRTVTRPDGTPAQAPDLMRVVVGVDPSVGTSEASGECGIVVCARGRDGHGYVLEDASVAASPDAWARRVAVAYRKHQADRVIAEKNQGGALVEHVLRTVDPNLPLTLVHASRGKQARAEPVAALYEQGRVHHVGLHAELETQLVSWVPGQGESPDRLDAAVWALTELLLDDDDDMLGIEERLERMTESERRAFFDRQASIMAGLYRL